MKCIEGVFYKVTSVLGELMLDNIRILQYTNLKLRRGSDKR